MEPKLEELKTVIQGEAGRKEMVSGIVDSLSGKFRNLTLASPNRVGSYDYGAREYQFWDSAWEQLDQGLLFL